VSVVRLLRILITYVFKLQVGRYSNFLKIASLMVTAAEGKVG